MDKFNLDKKKCKVIILNITEGFIFKIIKAVFDKLDSFLLCKKVVMGVKLI